MDETSVVEAVRYAAAQLNVGRPPTRRIVAAAHRQRRRRAAGWAGVAAGLVIAGGGLVLGSGLPSHGVAASTAVGGHSDRPLRSVPALPLVLPGQLPVGYRWTGPTGSVTDAHGQVILRRATFTSEAGVAAGSWVELCTDESGRAAERLAPAQACPRGAATIDREVDGFSCAISFSGRPTPEQRRFWREVPLAVDRFLPWLT